VYVLGYHGITDHSAPEHHFAGLFTDVRDFESQMEHLVRHFAPVGIEEVESAVASGGPLPHRAVHVTFDDGYKNNLIAAEILDRLKIPWTVFITVDSVLDGYQPWFLRLASAMEVTTSVMLPDGSVLDASGPDRKWYLSGRRLKCEIMASSNQDRGVERVLSWKGVGPEGGPVAEMLSVDEMKELHSAGTVIGNHSATHRNLLKCSDAELEAEITGARRRLERALGGPVEYFAYPDGRSNARVRKVVSAEHRLALSTWRMVRPWDRFAIRRYEPMSAGHLEWILDQPEPKYGLDWMRWNVPLRVREATLRAG
jgi:peptidoglycan/xylan/chitin deacetylase (PgdA/CDA1 family)